jgi:hypothetical protein
MFRKLARRAAARVGRSVMVSVFSRVAPDWRFRNIFPMVLAALGKPSGVSGALSRPKPPGTLWGDSGLSGSTENLRMALPWG